jgi:hypothetical protein
MLGGRPGEAKQLLGGKPLRLVPIRKAETCGVPTLTRRPVTVGRCTRAIATGLSRRAMSEESQEESLETPGRAIGSNHKCSPKK